MTFTATDPAASAAATAPQPLRRPALSWVPSPAMIAMKILELRRRRGLMIAVALLTAGIPIVVLVIRLLLHAFDPKSYGPAGSPGIFTGLSSPMAEFGFIAAATLGTAAATTDLTDGMFRHLVITGRSRLALYFARVPAGLAILLPLVAGAFAILCLVTCYAGIPQPKTVQENGISIPVNLNKAQLEAWLLTHPQQAAQALLPGKGPGPPPAASAHQIERQIGPIYSAYVASEPAALNPAINEMVKVGLWIELDVGIAFMVGLGFGSLVGQRTVATITMIVLEIIVTPLLANNVIPYFLNGQRLLVGIAMDQLRPAALSSVVIGATNRRGVLGGRGALGIPPMPTWAMVAVIIGWIAGWTIIGAWRMMTRDA